jgi:hypothetical protein
MSARTIWGIIMATYDAFISYSHAKDKLIAAALQSVVQKLGKPWYTPIPSVSEKWLARAGGNDSCCGHDSRRLS